MNVLVTGGTGTIGRRVVPLLIGAGEVVRVLSRHPGAEGQHVVGDTVRGRGLAFDGVDTVLHLAGGARGDDVAARNVVAAARRAGVGHLVLISVVGADRMPIGYFRAKARAEETFASSGVPWTLLRVAQLHEFVEPLVRGLSRLPVLPVPTGVRFEPVHVEEVARRLADLTLGRPAGRVPDLVGPEVLDVRALCPGRPSVPVRVPGAVGRAYRAGENLAGPGAQRGVSTWWEFSGSPVPGDRSRAGGRGRSRRPTGEPRAAVAARDRRPGR